MQIHMSKSETVSANHCLHLPFESGFYSLKYHFLLPHLNLEQCQVIDYCNLSVRTIEIFAMRVEPNTVKTTIANISMLS
jgi:hypothetical protein